MDDVDILDRVHGLVDQEHALRAHLNAAGPGAEEEQRRLRVIEETLDRCWDLLRQRRALREAGQDPDQAKARPVGDVESYLQ